jgi:lauroyl/myristoyl acyltransferase
MFNYILYRIGQFIAVTLPLKCAYGLSRIISDIRLSWAREDRRCVTANLKVIFPEKSEREIAVLRLGMSRNFAKYLVDFFRFQELTSDYIVKHIVIEGREHFDEALKQGKGVIVLTAHLGNWELGGVVLGLLGYPFWAVALPHKDKRVNDFFNFQRESKGVKVIPFGRAARMCLNLLQNNKMVALVGDRDFTGRGIPVDFFGKPALFPEGPAAFALQTGAPIVPGFMVRKPDDSFLLKIEKTISVEPTGNKQQDILSVTRQFAALFEDYIRRYPDQWYMFKTFWCYEDLRRHTGV